MKSWHVFWHVQAGMLRLVSHAPDMVSCFIFPDHVIGYQPKEGKVMAQKWAGSKSDDTHRL